MGTLLLQNNLGFAWGNSMQGSLVQNPSFETGTLSSWFLEAGNIAVTTGAAFAGTYGARMTTSGILRQTVGVTIGQLYNASVRLRVDTVVTAPTWGGMGVVIFDANFNTIAEHTITGPLDTWVLKTFSFVSPTANIVVSFQIRGDGQFDGDADEFLINAATPAKHYVTAFGNTLRYQGSTLQLRGTNFNNLTALYALTEGGFNIGAGSNGTASDINRINVAQADYQRLALLGGNHARFGISFHWYRLDRTAFLAAFDNHVAWAAAAGIWLIPVLFTTPDDCYEGYSFSCTGFWNVAAQEQAFKDFWVDMATLYWDEPIILGWDLLNEPVGLNPGGVDTYWFPLAQLTRDLMALVNHTQLVVVEAGASAQFASLRTGNNWVYSVHDYKPLSLTAAASQTAYRYPGTAPDYDATPVYWSRDAFAGLGDPRANLRNTLSINWAQTNNVPLYVGEWGTRIYYDGHAHYLLDHFGLFNEWGVSYAHYNWRHNAGAFGIYPLEGFGFTTNDQAHEALASTGWKGGGLHVGAPLPMLRRRRR